MASLFDLLGNSQKAAPADSGAKAQTIATVGATGKAAPSSGGAKASRLGERAALESLAVKLDEVASQAKTTATGQEQQIRQLNTQADLQNKQLDVTELEQRQSYVDKTTSMLNDLSRGKETLDLQKNGAKLEQLGHDLRMSDDKYVFNLQLEGDRARLDNQLSFQEQLMRTIFGDMEKLTQEDANFAKALAGSAADFQRYLGQMDAGQAGRIARQEAREAVRAAPIKAVTAAASGVASASSLLGKK